MRTTLSIDDDVLNAAKHEALLRNTTLSEVVTDLIRAGLRVSVGASVEPTVAIGHFATVPPREKNNRLDTGFRGRRIIRGSLYKPDSS